jgi:Sec-independent protein translocase protein TatA
MLDNLGLGEFFFLALLALLFFGPDRLPRIGAQLGCWIRGLTQYSSAFLNEWRDEALVIHDAVQEVKGIRDEIVAARTEIAGTLDTARTEVGDAVSGATRDVQQQIKHSTQILPEANTPPKAPTAEETGTDAAIARTQAILDELRDPRPAAADVPPSRSEPSGHDELETPSVVPRETPARAPPPQMPVQGAHQGAQFEGLRSQVDLLRTEMRALQAELAQIRARIEARATRARSEAFPADTTEREASPAVAPAVASRAIEPVGEIAF